MNEIKNIFTEKLIKENPELLGQVGENLQKILQVVDHKIDNFDKTGEKYKGDKYQKSLIEIKKQLLTEICLN